MKTIYFMIFENYESKILKENKMKINTALILCAGLAKRLNPLTLKTPKPLLQLNGKTMLEHCINMIKKFGLKKFSKYVSFRSKNF